MTIKECYEAMGGDYEDVLKRLMNEARIQKFALMFKKGSKHESVNTGDGCR